MNLHESIANLVDTGHADPAVIALKIMERHDEDWIARELLAEAGDLITEIARRELGARRRRAEVTLAPGDAVSQGELRIAKAWVPNVGWKVAGDLTREDLISRASWYERFADASTRRAEWCREVAALMDEQGVSRLGEVTGDLPVLRRGDLELANTAAG